jgi:hypothetical protein
MILKNSVTLKTLQPQAVIALMVANDIYREHGYVLCVTSVCDGTHMAGNLHVSGFAVDLRIKTLPAEMAKLLSKEIRNDLTSEFDVVLESDHIHIEYDPK